MPRAKITYYRGVKIESLYGNPTSDYVALAHDLVELIDTEKSKNETLKNAKFSFVFEKLDGSGKIIGGGNVALPAASTLKPLLVAAAFKKAKEEGISTSDKIIQYDENLCIKDRHSKLQGRYKNGITTNSLEELAELAIVDSDNDAANHIMKFLGFAYGENVGSDYTNKTFERWGLKTTRFGDGPLPPFYLPEHPYEKNITTTEEMNDAMKRLYNGEFMEKGTEMMRRWLNGEGYNTNGGSPSMKAEILQEGKSSNNGNRNNQNKRTTFYSRELPDNVKEPGKVGLIDKSMGETIIRVKDGIPDIAITVYITGPAIPFFDEKDRGTKAFRDAHKTYTMMRKIIDDFIQNYK